MCAGDPDEPVSFTQRHKSENRITAEAGVCASGFAVYGVVLFPQT